MESNQRWTWLAISGALLILTTGCGTYVGAPAKKTTATRATFTDSGSSDSDGSSGGGGSSSGATSTDNSGTDDTSSSSGLDPVYTFRVDGVGYNPATTVVEVPVRRVLKIQFVPNQNDKTIAGYNITPRYCMFGVFIKVGTVSQGTDMLDVGCQSGTPVPSVVLNFSGAFTKTCGSTDTSCRQVVRIVVEKPNYDGYWPNGAWSTVAPTHPWNGTLKIQTDDTEAL